MDQLYVRPPTPEAREQILAHADLAIQIFCNQISRDYEQFIKKHVLKNVPECKGLSLRELKIIVLTDGMKDKSLRSTEIASLLRVDAATATRGVNGLIDKNFLISEDDSYDNRAKRLFVTDKGQALVNAYRQQCIHAIQSANARLPVQDLDSFFQDGYDAFYALKDRAHAICNANLRHYHRFVTGQGRASKRLTPPKATLQDHADFIFQIFAEQVSSDYLRFIKKNVVKEMNAYRKMTMRELRVLMCIDFFKRPVSAADIAAIMRFEPATVSRGIATLIDDGLTQSLDCHLDGRSKLVSLTDEGQAYADRYRTVSQVKIQAAEDHLGMSLSLEDRTKLIKALTKIKNRSSQLASLRPPRRQKQQVRGNVIEGHFQDNFAVRAEPKSVSA